MALSMEGAGWVSGGALGGGRVAWPPSQMSVVLMPMVCRVPALFVQPSGDEPSCVSYLLVSGVTSKATPVPSAPSQGVHLHPNTLF